MLPTITVPARFRGPPESGNGGYVAGAIAERVRALSGLADDAAIEVTLRAPTPLDQPMQLHAGEVAHLMAGETLIAEATPASLELQIPQPPTFEAALAARDGSPAFIRNINPLLPDGTGFHPICFCCGADVAANEGLHVYAAPVDGFTGVAAAWRPPTAFTDADGYLPEPILWAALDCPGQFAYYASGIRTGMLGRMTGRILRAVAAEQNLRVIGWCLEVERSKHFAGTALFDQAGSLCGYSRQVWIGRMDQ